MNKIFSTILFSAILYSLCSAQGNTYGGKFSGNGDILSDIFIIQPGFVLDSVNNSTSNKTYGFEYDEQGKLIRDINFYWIQSTDTMGGRPVVVNKPGSRDYYYNSSGFIDSVGYGHWEGGVWIDDSSGYKITYSGSGKVISRITSGKNFLRIDEENTYDTNGNLVLSQLTVSGYTLSTTREYDSQNRLTERKILESGFAHHITRYVYRYDSSGNVNCTCTSGATTDTAYNWKCCFTFDETGRASGEIFLRTLLPDSTWRDTLDILFNYDGNGRILRMGGVVWFHYNADGNLDSLANVHEVDAGYWGTTATLIDSYGNTLSLSDCGGYNYLYYSEKIVGVGTTNVSAKTFALLQNYPNPFNPKTVISYQLSVASKISLKVYDLLGREVATLFDGVSPAGNFSRQWNAANMASGVYIYRLSAVPLNKGRNGQAGSFTESKKLLLLR